MMHSMLLPLLAFATATAVGAAGPGADIAGAAPATGDLPPEYVPCAGTVPVFNPAACPPPALTVEAENEVPGLVDPEADDAAAEDGSPANCRDRIALVREERGLPELQRQTAQADEPLVIAAVDHRVDGCSVMVMHHDTADIRPLPEADGEAALIPAD